MVFLSLSNKLRASISGALGPSAVIALPFCSLQSAVCNNLFACGTPKQAAIDLLLQSMHKTIFVRSQLGVIDHVRLVSVRSSEKGRQTICSSGLEHCARACSNDKQRLPPFVMLEYLGDPGEIPAPARCRASKCSVTGRMIGSQTPVTYTTSC